MSVITNALLDSILWHRRSPQADIDTGRKLLNLSRFRSLYPAEMGVVSAGIVADMTLAAAQARRYGGSDLDAERAAAKAYLLHCAKLNGRSLWYNEVVVSALGELAKIIYQLPAVEATEEVAPLQEGGAAEEGAAKERAAASEGGATEEGVAPRVGVGGGVREGRREE